MPLNQHTLDQIKIKAPSYLHESIKPFIQNTNTTPITHQFIHELGENALNAKQSEIEDFNGRTIGRNRKRLPDILSPLDSAILLCCVHVFMNIQPSSTSQTTLLGVYQESEPNKGTYSTNQDHILLLIKQLAPTMNTKQCQEVIADIKTLIPTHRPTSNPYQIPVNNGIFNKQTKTLQPFSPDQIYLAKLKIDYVENPINPIIIDQNDPSYQWDVDTWINDLANNDSEVDTLLWQVIADAIQGSYSRGKAILFYSHLGNNGKGTMGQLIKNLLGPGNYSSLAISDFKHEFLKGQLVGVIANIADENDVEQYIDSVRDFKASITSDDIIINPKFGTPFPFQFTGSNIQMINGLPKTKDKSDSFYRRIILVPFITSFTNNGERQDIKRKYIYDKAVLEYVLNKALLMDFDTFIQPIVTQQLLNEYKTTNNPVLQFWDEIEPEFQWDVIPTQFLYDLFVAWSTRNNPVGKPMNKRSFIELMRHMLDTDPSLNWKNSFDKPTRVSNRMDADEPLITEYNLVKWMDPQAASSPPPQQRAFIRNDYYRGIIRN